VLESKSLPQQNDWRVPEEGDVFEDTYGHTFTVDRVEPRPAEQGYVVGRWNDAGRDEIRFSTLNSGVFRLRGESS
jgi:hypothetical protein